jgi:subfamily B ATP-binding cassette protein MsbA
MHLKNGVLRDLKMYVKKIVELPISYYSERRKGDIMHVYVNEVQNFFFLF